MPIGPITPGSYVTVTPDASPLTKYASLQAPTATMDVTAADIQALTLALLNVQNQLGEGNFTELVNATNVEEGSRFLVPSVGWYYATALSSATADGLTILDSVGTPGFKWFHSLIGHSAIVAGPRIVWTGPVPGTSLPNGRIDPTIENDQLIFRNIHPPANATNTRAFADPTTSGDDLTGDALGAVEVGDIIRGNINVAVNCAATHFRMGVLVTQDNGSTYKLVTPQITTTLPVTFMPEAVAGDRVSVCMSFVHQVSASPTPSFAGWSLRGQGNGATLTANVGSCLVEVIRP